MAFAIVVPDAPTLRRMTATAVFLIVSMSLATAAEAQGRRARLSADLADHLAAGSASIDVIVHGTRAEVDALARKYNVRVKRYMRSGAVLRVTAGQLEALQGDESQEHLSADVPIRSIADVTAQSIGADQVWAGSEKLRPLTGAGIGVAVIDSGVDPRHAALGGRIAYTVDFTGGDGVDRYGHGTHVAALIAGRPRRASETSDGSEFRGIASGARIINLRVLGDDGSGMSSDVIEAVDWAVENRKQFDIQVINLSLGAPVTQPYRDDPMCEAVERAVAAGIIVVVAAGNDGLNVEGLTVFGSIATPGNDPAVITVGAADTHGTVERSDDTVAGFSSRGPTRFDLVLKPDLVAPGTRVVSAEAAGSYLARTYPQRHVAGAGANAYIQLSGTSMAAGVVSGTVALLLEQKPRLGPRNTKAVLQLTSSFMSAEGLIAGGTGSVNALAASEFAASRSEAALPRTSIAGETITASGIAFASKGTLEQRPISTFFLRRSELSRRAADAHTIFWGNADTIFWGSAEPSYSGMADTIYWGTADTIFWGSSDTISWGSTAKDTVYWSTRTDDTIFWGSLLAGDN
ncbi:MAG: S8 family peptidase [bacterium]